MTILLVIFAVLFVLWLFFKVGIDILSFIIDILGALLSAIFSGGSGGGSDDSGGGFGGGDSGGGGAEDSW